jgi:cysteine desulfurase
MLGVRRRNRPQTANAMPNTAVYLDYAATTPVDPRVAAAMAECLTVAGVFGNPSSTTHAFGLEAARTVERARQQVATSLGCDAREIIFTSGATEANNLCILGVARANADRGRHIVSARTEHRAVLDPCKQLEREGFRVTYLTPRAGGLIAPQDLRAAIAPDTQLVSLMHANNEIGVVQDIAAFAGICAERGVPLHTDACQSFGKIAFDVRALGVSFAAISAHKIYGPKGIGALFVAEVARPRIQPIIFGGGHERGLRSGTLPTHQIVGFGAAAEIAMLEHGTEAPRLASLRDRLWELLVHIPRVYRNGNIEHCLPGLLNVSIEGVEGESLVAGLDELAVSTGSACSSATREPSYVLRALGRDTELAQSSLRLSLGRFTTPAEVELAAGAIRREVERLRAVAP